MWRAEQRQPEPMGFRATAGFPALPRPSRGRGHSCRQLHIHLQARGALQSGEQPWRRGHALLPYRSTPMGPRGGVCSLRWGAPAALERATLAEGGGRGGMGWTSASGPGPQEAPVPLPPPWAPAHLPQPPMVHGSPACRDTCPQGLACMEDSLQLRQTQRWPYAGLWQWPQGWAGREPHPQQPRSTAGAALRGRRGGVPGPALIPLGTAQPPSAGTPRPLHTRPCPPLATMQGRGCTPLPDRS